MDEEPRNFEEDLKESNREELTPIWDGLLKDIFGRDISVKWKDDCKSAQLDFGCDVLIQYPNGRKYGVELKTRRNDYDGNSTYILEIAHHHYKDKNKTEKIGTKPGWLYTCTADYIAWGTYNTNKSNFTEICCFSLRPFKDEHFKSEFNHLKNAWADTLFPSGVYQLTLNKKIDLNFLRDNADFFYYRKIGGNLNDYRI